MTVVGGSAITVNFSAGSALLNEIKFIGISSFISDGWHEAVAGGGAVAGQSIVDVL